MQGYPEPTKKCFRCKEAKPFSDFSKCIANKDGFQSLCKSCDNQRRREYHVAHRDTAAAAMRAYREGPGRKGILMCLARDRAKAKGVPFSLTADDFDIPEFCPVLGIKLATGTGRGPAPHSPTLDRIDLRLGYVAGNVQVISSRANAMKNDANPDELRRFAAWVLKEFPKEAASDAV